MEIDDIEEFIQIDKRIDAAEDRVTDSIRESLRERWEFGRLMLAKRKGKQLPKGVMDTLVEATGKSPAELSFRAQFAERYPTEAEVSNALETFGSWRQAIRSLPKLPEPQAKSKPPVAPKRHDRHDEVAELAGEGKTYHEIAEQTGVGERQVRHIVEREHIEREAREEGRDDAVVVDFNSAPLAVKDRERILRKAIRREIEAEFEPQVQAEVQRRVATSRKEIEQLRADAQRVLEGRKGVMKRADYDLIRSCLHPDSRLSVTDERLAKAFRIFNEAEILLLNEADFPRTNGLPSLEELRKRRGR